MNLAAILLGLVTSGLFYSGIVKSAAPMVGGWSTVMQIVLLFTVELLAVGVGGFVTARLSGPERKQRRINASLMALAAGCLQIVSNGGGLHLVRFLIVLLYLPAALWGAGKPPWSR